MKASEKILCTPCAVRFRLSTGSAAPAGDLLRRVAPPIAADAQIGLLFVAPEAFDRAEAAAIFADHRARFGGLDLLIGAGLQKFADPKAASVARGTFCRQCMVGPDYLVAVGDIGLGAEKEGAVIREPIEITAGLYC